eukprot:GHVU01057094.1.p1 GENE.GHVU01057094.1~~GHVU01057094.1.p1  ORF type:complete len:253 (+),score=21.39 GHVU01057094.1:3216-3974(+)
MQDPAKFRLSQHHVVQFPQADPTEDAHRERNDFREIFLTPTPMKHVPDHGEPWDMSLRKAPIVFRLPTDHADYLPVPVLRVWLRPRTVDVRLTDEVTVKAVIKGDDVEGLSFFSPRGSDGQNQHLVGTVTTDFFNAKGTWIHNETQENMGDIRRFWETDILDIRGRFPYSDMKLDALDIKREGTNSISGLHIHSATDPLPSFLHPAIDYNKDKTAFGKFVLLDTTSIDWLIPLPSKKEVRPAPQGSWTASSA